MDISRLNNLRNILGLSKKVDNAQEPAAPDSLKGAKLKPQAEASPASSGSDTVSISLEGMIKKTAMEARQEATGLRQEKVKELKEQVSSGKYDVNPQELARTLLYGRDIYEELK